MQTQAYRGYLIKIDQIHDVCWISKNGFHIGSAKTLEQAKKEIDNLLD